MELTYILPFLAVVLGYIVALYISPNQKSTLKLVLAFSGAFLLTIVVSHLLPEVYEYVIHKGGEHTHNHSEFKKLGFLIMLGILFQIVLEYFSKGAEHGHTHAHLKNKNIPWLLFSSLCIHAFFEGLPIGNHNHLVWAIAIHHFPIAIILTLFFRQTKLSNRVIFVFMFLFALMTPLGTLLYNQNNWLMNYYAEIGAFVVGILFHISSTIIFESSEGHKFNARKLAAILIGIGLAMFL